MQDHKTAPPAGASSPKRRRGNSAVSITARPWSQYQAPFVRPTAGGGVSDCSGRAGRTSPFQREVPNGAPPNLSECLLTGGILAGVAHHATSTATPVLVRCWQSKTHLSCGPRAPYSERHSPIEARRECIQQRGCRSSPPPARTPASRKTSGEFVIAMSVDDRPVGRVQTLELFGLRIRPLSGRRTTPNDQQ